MKEQSKARPVLLPNGSQTKQPGQVDRRGGQYMPEHPSRRAPDQVTMRRVPKDIMRMYEPTGTKKTQRKATFSVEQSTYREEPQVTRQGRDCTPSPRKHHEPRSKSSDRQSRPKEKDKKPDKEKKKKKSKSLESLRSKFTRAGSAESVSRMVQNYQICYSLAELSRMHPNPPDGLLQLEPVTENTSSSTGQRSR